MVAVSVAMGGSKLPLFVIFKGKPDGKIEKSLDEILPDSIVGCVQRKGWMDSVTMNIWYNNVIVHTLLALMVNQYYYWMILRCTEILKFWN